MRPFFVTNTTLLAVVFLCNEVTATIDSSDSNLIREFIGTPLVVFVPIGILSTNIRYIFPFVEKNIIVSIVLVLIKSRIASSLFLMPFPPRRWTLKLDKGTLLIKPVLVVITTTSSGTTSWISFSSFGNSICTNSVLLLSPYFFTIVDNLSFNFLICKSLFVIKLLISFIVLSSSAFSFSKVTLSNLANLANFISKIALAWISEKLYILIRLSFATEVLSEVFIKWIISSILIRAFNNPSTICNLSSAFFKSNFASLNKQSILWSTYTLIASFKFNSVGVFPIKATWL